MTLNPDPAVVAVIDSLAKAAAANPRDESAMSALWRATFALERWIFIPRGELEQVRPFAVTTPHGPMVLAFTTGERAQAAGRAQGLSDDDVTNLLAIPTPEAIDWAARLGTAGIWGVVFDFGVTGYFAPAKNLISMRNWFASRPAG